MSYVSLSNSSSDGNGEGEFLRFGIFFERFFYMSRRDKFLGYVIEPQIIALDLRLSIIYLTIYRSIVIIAANHKDYPNNKRSRENLACDEASSTAAAAMNAGSSNGGRTPPLMRSCSSPAVYGKSHNLNPHSISTSITYTRTLTHAE